MSEVILAGDIGGTKTILALYALSKGRNTPLVKQYFSSPDFSTLEDMVFSFLVDNHEQIIGACFGIAGPIIENRAKVTNLAWSVEATTLSQAIGGAPVLLVNDLFAIANAIPYLQENELETIKTGVVEKHGAIGIVAPGTGLGEAFLIWSGAGYRSCSSEGGHSSFAPQKQEEIELLQYLKTRHEHVSFERVCSGIGVPNIFEFLQEQKGYKVSAGLRKKFGSIDDITPIIIQTGIEGRVKICTKTLEIFMSILANECANLALKIFASGGIYLAGGIVQHIKEKLKQPNFIERFCQKGRFSTFLEKVPIYLINNPEVGLLGAATLGQEHDWND